MVISSVNKNKVRILRMMAAEGGGGGGDMASAEFVALKVKWNGRVFDLRVAADMTLASVKVDLAELTNVLPKRQKIVTIKDRRTGKPVADETQAGDFLVKRAGESISCVMIGTAESEMIIYDFEKEESDVLNDLDLDYSRAGSEQAMNKPENVLALEKVTRKTQINMMHPFREGKMLLVLDLDYTLFDMKSQAANFLDLKRPYCDHFLTTAYQHYDICVWSQTGWNYLEMKLTELGILSHPDYRISFVLDKTAMFSISGTVRGKARKHQVKPLKLIWSKFPQFSNKNTLHIDDLSRNFAMNPDCGLKISAFKNAHTTRLSDDELHHLSKYIVLITNESDLSQLDHSTWKQFTSARLNSK